MRLVPVRYAYYARPEVLLMMFRVIPLAALAVYGMFCVFLIWVLWMVVKALQGIDVSLKEIARNPRT